MMSFIEALVRLRICLFPYLFCPPESSRTCCFITVLSLLLLAMVSVSHIYYRQRARFHCVCLSHWGCLIWVQIPKQKFESKLTVINPCSVPDKVRSFSIAEHALYGNFVINVCIKHLYRKVAFSFKISFKPLCRVFYKNLILLNNIVCRSKQLSRS